MSQAAIQNIVSEMYDAFLAEGIADDGVYTPAGGGTPVNCRVIVSRNVSPFGDFGKAISGNVELGLLLQEIPTPHRGATVLADSRTWTLVQCLKQDDAVSTWSVS